MSTSGSINPVSPYEQDPWDGPDPDEHECDECDGSGTYYLNGEPQACICSEPQDDGDHDKEDEEHAA